jgi:hypothetical protein
MFFTTILSRFFGSLWCEQNWISSPDLIATSP